MSAASTGFRSVGKYPTGLNYQYKNNSVLIQAINQTKFHANPFILNILTKFHMYTISIIGSWIGVAILVLVTQGCTKYSILPTVFFWASAAGQIISKTNPADGVLNVSGRQCQTSTD